MEQQVITTTDHKGNPLMEAIIDVGNTQTAINGTQVTYAQQLNNNNSLLADVSTSESKLNTDTDSHLNIWEKIGIAVGITAGLVAVTAIIAVAAPEVMPALYAVGEVALDAATDVGADALIEGGGEEMMDLASDSLEEGVENKISEPKNFSEKFSEKYEAKKSKGYKKAYGKTEGVTGKDRVKRARKWSGKAAVPSLVIGGLGAGAIGAATSTDNTAKFQKAYGQDNTKSQLLNNVATSLQSLTQNESSILSSLQQIISTEIDTLKRVNSVTAA